MSAARTPNAARPLRWIKFVAGIGAGMVALTVATPACRVALAVIARPYSEAVGAWSLLPAVAVGAFVLASWAWLIADASFERCAPKGLVAALVGVAIATSAAPGAFRPAMDGQAGIAHAVSTAPGLVAPQTQGRAVDLARSIAPVGIPPGAGGRAAGDAIASSLVLARSIAAGALVTRKSTDDVRAIIEPRLDPSPYVDRFFRQVPASVVVLEGRDSPVFDPRPGDPPGTLYLALAPAGDAGWLTASVLDGDRISIFRDAGRPLVLGVVACDPNDNGGAAC